MAKKQPASTTSSQSDSMDNPLDNVEPFNLSENKAAAEGEKRPFSPPLVSPLGPPRPVTHDNLSTNAPSQQHLLQRIKQLEAELKSEKSARKRLERRNIELETAVKFAESTQAELDNERHTRLQIERECASLEAELRQKQHHSQLLEEERQRRLELEKQLSSLEVRAERAQEVASQLHEERQRRVELEREKATLDVQVESLQKIERLLAEERQARMNAQSRAASAEAQLARLEGQSNKSSDNSSSLMDRLRGR